MSGLQLLRFALCFGTLIVSVVSSSTVLAQNLPTEDSAADAPVSATETVDLSAFNTAAPVVSDTPANDVSADRQLLLLSVYCGLIVVASLAGGRLPFLLKLTHTRMQTIISFVGGLMLGIGVFHMMPHAVHELGSSMSQIKSAQAVAQWMMVGIVMMFIMLRLFHFHNHEPVGAYETNSHSTCNHGHDHDHDHDHVGMSAPQTTGEKHSPAECHTHGHTHGISWFGIAAGLSLHTLIDGLALGASVQTHATSSAPLQLFGFATFLAVLLHKPLDAVSITSLMVAGGWKTRTIHLVNAGFSMMCPLGAALFLLGVQQFAGYQREILGTALAFSAGVFVCISLSDLLPEMEFHSHNKVQLTIALGLGIVLAWSLTLLEQPHFH